MLLNPVTLKPATSHPVRSNVLRAMVPLLLATSACPVLAQTSVGSAGAASDPGSATADADGTIVVTAQLRRESLQDVPLAISAVSGETLLARGINNPIDLRFVAPSLNFANSANTRGEGLSIRGVGTNIFGDGVEQSVGVVVDGIPMARNGMGIMSMIDVSQVEILRGPQGMLFGKNASAGIISIQTNRPVLGKTSIEAGMSYATLNDIRANAAANIAIGDQGALRLAYSATRRDGIIDDIQTNQLLNNRNENIVRGSLLVEPAAGLSIRIIGDWSNSRSLCCAFTARAVAPGQAFAALNAAAGITPGPANLQNAAGGAFFQNLDQWGFSGQIDYDAGWATLTSITGYRRWIARDNNDPDILPLNVLDVNGGNSKLNQTTQELRLTSPSNQPFEWTLGAFFMNVGNVGDQTQGGRLGQPLPPGFTLSTQIASQTFNTNKAIYGQIVYTFFDKLKLSASARYTWDELRFNWTSGQAPGTAAPIPGRFLGTVNGAQRNDQNLSFRLIAQYDFTDDINAFASVARGYKGAAYDQGLVSQNPVFVDPEIPTSYEAGVRAQLFDRKATINLTGFNTNFKNFQAQAFDQNVFPARFTTVNAGGLRTRGVEAEVNLRPTDGLRLTGNATYLDTRFTDFQNIACFIGQPRLPASAVRTDDRQCINGLTNGTGLGLPDAPRFTYALMASYDVPVGRNTLNLAANWFRRSSVTYATNGDPGLFQAGYGLLGANISLRSPTKGWVFSVFARNLLDQNFVARIVPQPVLNSGVGSPVGSYSQFPSADARRILGLSFNAKFGGR